MVGRGRSRRVAKFLLESILIAFGFVQKILLSDIEILLLLGSFYYPQGLSLHLNRRESVVLLELLRCLSIYHHMAIYMYRSALAGFALSRRYRENLTNREKKLTQINVRQRHQGQRVASIKRKKTMTGCCVVEPSIFMCYITYLFPSDATTTKNKINRERIVNDDSLTIQNRYKKSYYFRLVKINCYTKYIYI